MNKRFLCMLLFLCCLCSAALAEDDPLAVADHVFSTKDYAAAMLEYGAAYDSLCHVQTQRALTEAEQLLFARTLYGMTMCEFYQGGYERSSAYLETLLAAEQLDLTTALPRKKLRLLYACDAYSQHALDHHEQAMERCRAALALPLLGEDDEVTDGTLACLSGVAAHCTCVLPGERVHGYVLTDWDLSRMDMLATSDPDWYYAPETEEQQYLRGVLQLCSRSYGEAISTLAELKLEDDTLRARRGMALCKALYLSDESYLARCLTMLDSVVLDLPMDGTAIDAMTWQAVLLLEAGDEAAGLEKIHQTITLSKLFLDNGVYAEGSMNLCHKLLDVYGRKGT